MRKQKQPQKKSSKQSSSQSVAVVVLGDIGRSPRMQYHCISLARSGIAVDLIGYLENTPLAALTEDGLPITIHPLPSFGAASKRRNVLAYLMHAIFKIILTTLHLLRICFCIPRPSHFLVQVRHNVQYIGIVHSLLICIDCFP
jgi:beta-1,4-mannosyltransferase